MKENNINPNDIDFKLSNIERDIKAIALSLSNSKNDTKKSSEEKGALKSAYGSIKETKTFLSLLDWIFTDPAKTTVVAVALSKLFLPLVIHYHSQYPYIKQYLETHTRVFDQD